MRKRTLLGIWAIVVALLIAPLDAGVFRYGYRVLNSSADPTLRPPRFFIVDTTAELPSSGVGEGDLAYSKDDDKLWKRIAASWAEVASTAALTDGDKGDITVSASGATWTVDNDAVSFQKMQNIDQFRILGRNSAGAGDPEMMTIDQVLSWFTSVQGSFLYRGPAGWSHMVPGAAGQVLTTGGTGADPSWTTPSSAAGVATALRVTSDVTNTSNTAWGTITGLSLGVASGTSYTFNCEILYTTALTSTAIHLSLSGVTMDALDYCVTVNISATATHDSCQTAYDTATNPDNGGGSTRLSARIGGSLDAGATGTVNIRFKSEAAGSAVTATRGSQCVFLQI